VRFWDAISATAIYAPAGKSGLLTLIGSLLGLFISLWFFAIPAFVGAGLITAGVTGFCGMTRILMRLPGNRAVYNPKPQSA
jgi:hypothetical protein